MKIYIHSPQDPSVGMFPLSTTVTFDYWPDDDPDYRQLVREMLVEAFSEIFDDGGVYAVFEDEQNFT